MLPWSWAGERLAAAHNYWIATIGPHASPVWGLWRDESFLFSCGARSRKARDLARDPRLVVHLESGDEVVIVEGVAAPVAATEADVEEYERKYAYWRGANGTTRAARRGSTSPPPRYRVAQSRACALQRLRSRTRRGRSRPTTACAGARAGRARRLRRPRPARATARR